MRGSGKNECTSAKAVAAFWRGSEKSPYSTVSFAFLPWIVTSWDEEGWDFADATNRVKLSGPSFLTLFSHVSKAVVEETIIIPRIENINTDFLRCFLNCSDFLVQDGLSSVVVWDVPKTPLANEVAGLRENLIDMLFELCNKKQSNQRYVFMYSCSYYCLTSFHSGTAFAALADFATTTLNLSCGIRGTILVNPKDL